MSGDNTESANGEGSSTVVEVESGKKEKKGKQEPPPFIDDPSKITLKFIFANRDGIVVTVDCKPTDTVGEVKGVLLSMWPDDLPKCPDGDRLRLVCMGKGVLSPDSRTMEDCQVPVFSTHATPINVAVKPENIVDAAPEKKASPAANRSGEASTVVAAQGCMCVIL